MNFLLTKFGTKFWVSRTKTLLKRRRKHVKSRPISDKKRQQQSKHFNYARQYRALQIKKQLDKSAYSSQHINQLMDQIFYPDVTLAHEEAARIQMEVSSLKQYNIEQIQQDQNSKQLKQKVLATEMIQYYLQNMNQLQVSHFLILCKKLTSYFLNKQRIKESTLKKWQKINQTLKKTDPNYKQKKCPYIFLDKQDTLHYQPWLKSIQHLTTDIKKILQRNNKATQQQIQIFLLFSQIIQQINKAIDYIPFTLYEIFSKFLSKLNQQQIFSLDLDSCQSIIKSLKIRKSVRYPIHNVISQNIKKQQLFSLSKQKIVLRMLAGSNIKVSQLQDLITCFYIQQINFSQKINETIRPIILQNLSELTFQKCVQLLSVYIKNGKESDIELIQLIKFDALRKSPNFISKNQIFRCMEIVNDRQITIQIKNNKKQPEKVKIYGYDIFHQCAIVFSSRYCGRNLLQYDEVLKLAKFYYSNHLDDINLLQLLANQLVKQRDKLSLTQLTDCVFMINLLNYRSYVLVRILFEEHKKRYHQALKRVKNKQVLLLSGQISGTNSLFSQEDKIDRQQIQLQENLLINIWLLFINFQEFWTKNKLPIPMDELMKLYPLHTASKHPLIYQICLNLNQISKKNSILWKIKCLPPDQNNNKHNQNRLNKYYERNPKQAVYKAIKLQAKQCQRFFHNWNKNDRLYLPQKWSKYYTYDMQQYINYISSQQQKSTNYFNKDKQISGDLKNLREQAIRQNEKKIKLQNRAKKSQKQSENNQELMYRLD